MQDQNTKQQIVERIKNATNILVTVSRDPSVDELSAALGFTLMLNKMDKHATAVFSGKIPAAIEFLEPGKTFENTVDSLRDFIIALDKSKADRLRYKVDGDVVKVFITPYRTVIDENDLEFSQGDYNVELVVALNVDKREDLDAAIQAHGRILHDAAVVTVNTRQEKSSLGVIDWQDSGASSLCEMLMSLSEALQSNLLDEQIANALLTGIVAATERFSNEHTTPRVMTMAAQLMAAGANQQLIATKLEEAHEIPAEKPKTPEEPDGTTNLSEGESSRIKKEGESDEPPKPKKGKDGEMLIDHDESAVDETPEEPKPKPDEEQNDAEAKLDQAVATAAPSSLPNLEQELSQEEQQAGAAPAPLVPPSTPVIETPPPAGSDTKPSWMGKRLEPPTMGGTLSATAEQAFEDKQAEDERNRNKTILSHDEDAAAAAIEEPPVAALPPLPPPLPEPPTQPAPAPIVDEPNVAVLPELPTLDPVAPTEEISHSVDGLSYEPAATPPPPTLEELEAQAKAAAQTPPLPELPPQPTAAPSPPSVDDARSQVDNVFNNAPFDPANQPLQSLGAQPFPALQHEPVTAFPEPPETHPSIQQHHEPMMPPMPDFNTLPPVPQGFDAPPMQPGSQPPPASLNPPPAPGSQSASDPNAAGQFRIPGQ